MDELLPTVLAAGGTAAEFCSSPEIWPLFEKWLYEDREPDGEVTREFMSMTATVTLLLVQGLEREVLAEQAAEFLASRAVLNLRHPAQRDIIRDERERGAGRPGPSRKVMT